jgi:prepilin-type processing-associated H-X9-DG protein
MDDTNPYESPKTEGTRQPEKKKTRKWFSLVELFAVIAVIGILVLLLLPAKQGVREGARRNQCGNQLRQIGVALRAYQDDYGCLPPAYVADQSGRPAHSWRVLILPYLDEQRVYEKYNFDEPWDYSENFEVAQDFYYSCPSWADATQGKTTYMLLVGPGTLFDGDCSVNLDELELPDRGSRTIIAAETTSPGATWTQPVDLDVTKMTFRINAGPGEIGSDHSGGVAMVLFADGHIEALSAEITPEELRKMCIAEPAETR